MTDAEKKVLTHSINDLILQAVPKATTCPKYGGMLYTLKPDEKEGQFCGVFVYKHHVQLTLAHGTELDDPQGILQGNGKFRRHINFAGADELEDKAKPILRLLKQAAKKS